MTEIRIENKILDSMKCQELANKNQLRKQHLVCEIFLGLIMIPKQLESSKDRSEVPTHPICGKLKNLVVL